MNSRIFPIKWKNVEIVKKTFPECLEETGLA